jgi:hypothetical protein
VEKTVNDELHDLYSSLNIVRLIKSRRMRWTEHFGWEARREETTGKTLA